MPMPDSESVSVIPGSVLLWRIAPRPPNSAQVRLACGHGLAVHVQPRGCSSRVCRPCWRDAGGRGPNRPQVFLVGSGAVPAHPDPESQDFVRASPVPGRAEVLGRGLVIP